MTLEFEPIYRELNEVDEWQTFEATAYTAFCSTGCIGITRTGYDVSSTIYSPSGHRVIAVDPDVIPLHSVVEVRTSDGDTFTAKSLDTGGVIQGEIIDVLHETKTEAREFGRQAVDLRIIEEGE